MHTALHLWGLDCPTRLPRQNANADINNEVLKNSYPRLGFKHPPNYLTITLDST